ncbi:MAG: lysophospholipid acyltransferase family protein [Planctomycetota bacterium]|nr:lysophospholipid acyltransferase family protein [Planctomycetota bacterium]
MKSEAAAVLTLAAYFAIATCLVVRSLRRCPDGWGVWLLYVTQRLYSGLVFRWRCDNGPCPLPATGGGLVVANHRSPVDPMMVWTNHHLRGHACVTSRDVRVVGFLTASEYCTIPGMRWIVRTMQSIPVDRNGQDMAPTREALRRLRNGQLVGIFPEGAINWGTRLRVPNPGVAFLALKGRVPVYPVFIHDAPQPSDGMVRPFTHRSRVRVTYGEPIDLSAFHGQKATPELLNEVTNLIMSRLAETGGVDYTPVGMQGEPEAEPGVNRDTDRDYHPA